jgi:hypothetical protein
MLKPSATDDSGVDDSAEEADDRKGPPKLFTISLVNSYGNMTLEELKNDGEPLQLSSELNIHCFSIFIKGKKTDVCQEFFFSSR